MSTQRNIPPRTVGVIVHRVIADLLQFTRAPSASETRGAIKERTAKIGDRSHTPAVRQRIFGLVSLYFWHLALDEGWEFIGAELAIGTGKVDLVFCHNGRILIDEVKSGVDSALALGSATKEQTDRYVSVARQMYGERLVGIRVLSLTDHRRSLFKTNPGARLPLVETPYYPGRNN